MYSIIWENIINIISISVYIIIWEIYIKLKFVFFRYFLSKFYQCIEKIFQFLYLDVRMNNNPDIWYGLSFAPIFFQIHLPKRQKVIPDNVSPNLISHEELHHQMQTLLGMNFITNQADIFNERTADCSADCSLVYDI